MAVAEAHHHRPAAGVEVLAALRVADAAALGVHGDGQRAAGRGRQRVVGRRRGHASASSHGFPGRGPLRAACSCDAPVTARRRPTPAPDVPTRRGCRRRSSTCPSTRSGRATTRTRTSTSRSACWRPTATTRASLVQVFQKKQAVLGGMDEAIAILRECAGRDGPDGAWVPRLGRPRRAGARGRRRHRAVGDRAVRSRATTRCSATSRRRTWARLARRTLWPRTCARSWRRRAASRSCTSRRATTTTACRPATATRRTSPAPSACRPTRRPRGGAARATARCRTG